MKAIKSLIAFCVITCLATIFTAQNADCFVNAIPKLSTEVIKKLAGLGKGYGAKAVGTELAQYAAKVPNNVRDEFLESTYLRVLVEQGRLTPGKAEELFANLAKVPGFRSSLSKMCGMSDAKAVGHGYEVMLASSLKKKGYKIIEIGQRYDDGIKAAATDIDLVTSKGGNKYIFELKNYQPSNIDHNSVINFRADMQSLNSYASKNPGTKSFFVISNKPADPNIEKLLEAHAKAQNVKIIYGDSDVIPILLDTML